LISWVQRLEKSHQRSCLRWTQILPIGWHISPALNDLADKLIFRESQSNAVERRPALTSLVIQRMTVVTLLCLENERTMTL
jgi:hypothetical protein